MLIKPEILNTKVVAKSRLFAVEEVSLRFSNGEARVFERLQRKRRSAVMIAPMLDNETVLLIREYGVGIEDYFLGLPKGIVDDGETILAAANRELMEEVGYGAKDITFLTSLAASPGYLSSSMDVVLAQNLYPQKREGDEPEPLEVVPWKLADLDRLLKRNDFNEARSIATMYMLRDRFTVRD